MGKGLPVNTLIGDPSLTSHLTDSDNPYIISSVKTWRGLIKKYQLEGRAEILKWFAYDLEFLPSKHDMRFILGIFKSETLLEFFFLSLTRQLEMKS